MLARANVILTNRVHDQCVFETHLADQLRAAGQRDRLGLYARVYDEYSKRFPEHLPKDSSKAERVAVYETLFMRRFLTPSTIVAEIGPGRCHLAFEIAPLAAKVYGVDVAAMDPGKINKPPNFEFRPTNGIHMPFDSDSLDLVISNQLMEHLHPEDVTDQLKEVYRVLRTGGSYVCVTPSRVNGPHDCSAYFDDLPCPIQAGDYQATGLHLREYTTQELVGVLKNAGFAQVKSWVGTRGHYVRLPPKVITGIERAVRLMPPDRRKRSRILSVVLGNRMCATK